MKIEQSKLDALRALNKYNLKPTDLKKAKVVDFEKIKKPPFWYNPALESWQISVGVGPTLNGESASWYWIRVLKDGDIGYGCTAMFGMCGYRFTEFFKESEIENNIDIELQTSLLNTMNWLIDEKIIEIEGVNNVDRG